MTTDELERRNQKLQLVNLFREEGETVLREIDLEINRLSNDFYSTQDLEKKEKYLYRKIALLTLAKDVKRWQSSLGLLNYINLSRKVAITTFAEKNDFESIQKEDLWPQFTFVGTDRSA